MLIRIISRPHGSQPQNNVHMYHITATAVVGTHRLLPLRHNTDAKNGHEETAASFSHVLSSVSELRCTKLATAGATES